MRSRAWTKIEMSHPGTLRTMKPPFCGGAAAVSRGGLASLSRWFALIREPRGDPSSPALRRGGDRRRRRELDLLEVFLLAEVHDVDDVFPWNVPGHVEKDGEVLLPDLDVVLAHPDD